MYNLSFAEHTDANALLRIYNEYINTPITFEYRLPTEKEFAQRIADICAFYPYIICKKDSVAVGYAYAHRHKEREAYKWNAELSVYIDKDERSHGIGGVLYNCIFEISRLQNIVNAYACITIPNEASDKFHTALGFTRVGEFQHTGYKCGQWHGVSWYEKAITEIINPPVDPVSIDTISFAVLSEILRKGESKLNK